tara:strand:- start:354 stop:1088 length:735 start_codon:yes stop_codon:yes gene_type:complete
MMRKILLVSGCSNTDKDFYSELHPDMDCSWPKWPELLAKKLDMDCVNLAKCGAGNEYIYRSLLNYITRNDTSNIGLVIPAWSQCNRKDYQEGGLGRFTNARIDPNGDVFGWVRRSLDNMLSFQIVCEKYNLPYIHVHMLHLYKDWLSGLKPREGTTSFTEGFRHSYPGNPEKDTKKIIKIIDNYEELINTEKFIGWPLASEMGGYSLQKNLIKQEMNTRLSEIDSHPNKLGQEKIMEFIYDRLV